jgi:hypothetical protein
MIPPTLRPVPLCVLTLLIASACQGAVLRVKHDAPGPNDGLTWQTAYPNLPEVLAVAAAGDEVWVPRGNTSWQFRC